MSFHTYDVCIRGSGIVGRALALLLARHRLHVGLVESPTFPGQQADIRALRIIGGGQGTLMVKGEDDLTDRAVLPGQLAQKAADAHRGRSMRAGGADHDGADLV